MDPGVSPIRVLTPFGSPEVVPSQDGPELAVGLGETQGEAQPSPLCHSSRSLVLRKFKFHVPRALHCPRRDRLSQNLLLLPGSRWATPHQRPWSTPAGKAVPWVCGGSGRTDNIIAWPANAQGPLPQQGGQVGRHSTACSHHQQEKTKEPATKINASTTMKEQEEGWAGRRGNPACSHSSEEVCDAFARPRCSP